MFAFNLIEQALNGDLSEAEFELARIVSDHPGQWMGGFEERSDNVRNGILYGDDIEYDGDIGTAFRNSDKNMIGPDIDYGGQTLRLRMGSNWFQVLKPGDFTRKEYLNFLDQYLRKYL
ncbi:hypothetical protein AV929_01775 [Haloarcula sp. K1]|nr:hypothetical protein AV929_01775 [Haloarcula sp. K1]